MQLPYKNLHKVRQVPFGRYRGVLLQRCPFKKELATQLQETWLADSL